MDKWGIPEIQNTFIHQSIGGLITESYDSFGILIERNVSNVTELPSDLQVGGKLLD